MATEEYVEQETSVVGYFKSVFPHPVQQSKDYVRSLFPFLTWIHRYNAVWGLGDLIAGVTVGAVVIPQGMAYAKLAQLPPEFGLYSSFVGVTFYFLFATSKDITIGPVAVMSLLLGNIITKVQAENSAYQPYEIGAVLALLAGVTVLGMGLLRLGFITNFISLPAIAAFMTGSAFTIIVGQVPALLGIKGVNNREAAYKVVINTLKALPRSKLDSAMGLTALFLLYLIRHLCARFAKRYPKHERTIFFISTLRTVTVILLYTMISWLVNRTIKKTPKFAILGTVPRGFQHVGAPNVDLALMKLVAYELPWVIIVLLIEHISISRSFGRVNNYTIDPNQELIAIGITNVLGPLFSAYPATGSFSRTAIKAKAGVRTPLAGVWTSIVVILAIYVLPPLFFYIPSASLSAVIIHAVGDLFSSPQTTYSFFKVNPVEFLAFLIGVFVIVFASVEYGIIAVVCISAVLLLWRVAFAKGQFLGQVQVHLVQDGRKDASREIYFPLDHSDGLNPKVKAQAPPAGIFIFRINEAFLYPNASHFTDQLVAEVFAQTKPSESAVYKRLGDRPWNDPGPRHVRVEDIKEDTRPDLAAIVLDFGGVPHLDVTGVSTLVDVRAQIDRRAGRQIPWHFAGIRNPWIKRGLITAGFGSAANPPRTILSAAYAVGADSEEHVNKTTDIENADNTITPLLATNRPLFHADLFDAVRAAEDDIPQGKYTRKNSDGSAGSSSIRKQEKPAQVREEL